MDWKKCIICRTDGGDLRTPANTSPDEARKSYDDFLKLVEQFEQLHCSPVEFVECGNTSTLLENSAKWHKQCRLKFSQSKLDRTKERLNKKRKIESNEGGRKFTRQSTLTPLSPRNISEICIFCMEAEGVLHNCSTLTLDKTLRNMACELQDTELLVRIGGGDLIAIEAKYHNTCLTSYKNRHRSMERKKDAVPSGNSIEEMAESRVFVELVMYVESCVEEGNYIFKLSDIHHLYENRLGIMGFPKIVNKSRLKKKLLEHFLGDCQEQSDGKNLLLVFNEGLQKLMKDTMQLRDFDQEALSMARVSKFLRTEISNAVVPKFSGTFVSDCEEQSAPANLKSFVSMLLYGPNIKDESVKISKACLTICQLIVFNHKIKISASTENMRHTKSKEPPLPLYLGIYVHAHTRSKALVTQLYERGISVSYDRVLELEDWLTTAACQRYRDDDLVCPTQLRKDLLTVGALDNIDHNPSSTTSVGSFHGTSISVFQFPSVTNPGIPRPKIIVPPTECSAKPTLPNSYRIVPAVACHTDSIKVPDMQMRNIEGHYEKAMEEELQWIKHRIPILHKEKIEKDDEVAWGAYHASRQTEVTVTPGIISLLPLFEEKAASIAMVKHGMDILRAITESCNPSQVPVIAVDQPLFALAKYVQWRWPEMYGENKYVVMMGGLHIEMAMWSMVGDMLQNTGWIECLTEAKIASSGMANSFLTTSHLTRTRHAHQVTALSLAMLQDKAFKSLPGPHNDEAFIQWKKDMIEKNPTFEFWNLNLELETKVLIFVRSHRERNFPLYVEVMEQLVPCFFILDHINYARWLPVHIRDMKCIPDGIKDQFQSCWSFPKTSRKFSSMPLDQAHEQNNKIVKIAGGAVGLTENRDAFRRWMVSGPELSRILNEFENLTEVSNGDNKSHEQGFSTQKTFKDQVNNLVESISSKFNPFLECDELINIYNHDCVGKEVVSEMRTMQNTAINQYSSYVKDVLIDRTVSINRPLKKNHVILFQQPGRSARKSNSGLKDDLKSDYGLFAQLFIACQVRQSDLSEFFSHENHPWPPSISKHGDLRLTSDKSDLLSCLSPTKEHELPNFDVKIFDGPSTVHALPRYEACTFGDYSDIVFLPWLDNQLKDCPRIDVVWDTYKKDSLKETTRVKRGKGERRKVTRETTLPKNFVTFLQNSENKTELFTLLSDAVAAHDVQEGKELYITYGKCVISKNSSTPMPETDHEEADTRMCLHILDALRKGATYILISTVDTDVVVILVSIFFKLLTYKPNFQLWVAFSKGKHFRYYHINAICKELGENMSQALLFFHAFTGSDTTSQFSGKGKKTAWKTWKAYPSATEGFLYPAKHPYKPINDKIKEFKLIERFTCILYDGTTELGNINKLREDLFAQGTQVKMMHSLPPTQDALIQHTNRCIYQSSIWLNSLKSFQDAPTPAKFGWKNNEETWQPIWMTIPEAGKSCRELIKCGCKAEPLCSKNCFCKKAALACTALCHCKGHCGQ